MQFLSFYPIWIYIIGSSPNISIIWLHFTPPTATRLVSGIVIFKSKFLQYADCSPCFCPLSLQSVFHIAAGWGETGALKCEIMLLFHSNPSYGSRFIWDKRALLWFTRLHSIQTSLWCHPELLSHVLTWFQQQWPTFPPAH